MHSDFQKVVKALHLLQIYTTREIYAKIRSNKYNLRKNEVNLCT